MFVKRTMYSARLYQMPSYVRDCHRVVVMYWTIPFVVTGRLSMLCGVYSK